MSYPKLHNVQNYTQVPFDGEGDEGGGDNGNWVSNCQTSNLASTSCFETNALILTLLICEVGTTAVPNSKKSRVSRFSHRDKRAEGEKVYRAHGSVHSHVTRVLLIW